MFLYDTAEEYIFERRGAMASMIFFGR